MGTLDRVAKVNKAERENFLAYEDVRQSGVTNMFAIRHVCDLSGLDRETVEYIMKNYTELAKKYL